VAWLSQGDFSMKSALVDTHAAIWYLLNSKKLSASAEKLSIGLTQFACAQFL
jgi:PIN domain nuclease of toxin-antitoxin system